MPRAIEVARCLVRLAMSEDEPDPLTHLRLQKLLYYAQGWSLAQRGKALFEDQIQAWAHGPVVPEIYQLYKDQRWNPILPDDEDFPAELSDDDRDYIASVWESFKGYSATSLREMTHAEAPWLDARRGFGPAQRCDVEITPEAMRAYFSKAD